MSPQYRLIDGHIIAADVLDETTGRMREPRLDLDYCLARDHASGDHSYYVAAYAPRSFTEPDLCHTTALPRKLSDATNHHESLGNAVTSELNGSMIHMRDEIYVLIFPNKVADSYINLNDYIRCTKTGRLEWMHPSYKAFLPEWLEAVLKVATAMSKTPANAFEMAVDMAKDQLTAGLVPEVQDYSKEYMRGTYVDKSVGPSWKLIVDGRLGTAGEDKEDGRPVSSWHEPQRQNGRRHCQNDSKASEQARDGGWDGISFVECPGELPRFFILS